jgi:hypothetical protein
MALALLIRDSANVQAAFSSSFLNLVTVDLPRPHPSLRAWFARFTKFGRNFGGCRSPGARFARTGA